VAHNSYQVVKWLLNQNFDLGQTNSDGDTVLDIARGRGSWEMYRLIKSKLGLQEQVC